MHMCTTTKLFYQFLAFNLFLYFLYAQMYAFSKYTKQVGHKASFWDNPGFELPPLDFVSFYKKNIFVIYINLNGILGVISTN